MRIKADEIHIYLAKRRDCRRAGKQTTPIEGIPSLIR
jgi:hypothetical protein